jgi:hypothetical protein
MITEQTKPDNVKLDERRAVRIQLLVIVIWFGGILNLFSHESGPGGWSWDVVRWFIAVAAMFVLGCFAFASVTEFDFVKSFDRGQRRLFVFVLFIGGIAAISVGFPTAPFLMFLLTGFALDWWGTAK